MDETVASDLRWAEQALTNHLHDHVTVTEVVAVPARAGRLHRLDVVTGGQSRRFFLKRYTPAANDDWHEHASDLRLIADVIKGDSGLLPFVLAGVDADRQLTLAAESPGESARAGGAQERIWFGVGSWLARLHSLRAGARPTRPAEVATYSEPRFRQWMERDPEHAEIALRGIMAASALVGRLGSQADVALCHGDISSANIRVYGQSIGLIDFDDVRVDMPAVDLSQAELEIEELSRRWSGLRSKALASRARDALRSGYGPRYPEGPAFWLPHLRNLAVFLTTLAGHRQRGLRHRLASSSRYGRTIAELERTIANVQAGGQG